MSVLLDVQAVTRKFAGMVAVDEVSFSVAAGEILGIIGPNGAGKTTLFNLLTGQLKVNGGDVFFGGESITGKPVHERVRLGLGRTFQVVRPLPDLTVLENTMMGAFSKHPRRGDAEKKAIAILEKVDLAELSSKRAGDLPLAGRNRLEVARAIATEPSILLLDEVMAGLNPTEIEAAIGLFRRLHGEGMTLILIEHNLKVVRSLAQRVLVLDHGMEIAEGTPADVLEHPDVVRAYLGNRR